MAPDHQRQDDPRDRNVARPARPAASGRRVRITVPVPPVVDLLLSQAGKDVSEEIDRVVAAYFRKLTPVPCRSPYTAELHSVERLLAAPTETLTRSERVLVLVYRAQEGIRELEAAGAGSEAVQDLIEKATVALGALVDAALEVVRADKGDGTNELEWEVTRP